MKQRFISVALTAAALLLSVNLSCAAESTADAAREAASKAKAVPTIAKSEINAKHRAAANIKPVDINGATRKQLKKLPGIGDAEAGKIIASRPYGSKADLVTHNVIDRRAYENIKKQVIAKQPYRDGGKNAALYNKK